MGTNHYQRFYNYGRKWLITGLVGVTIGLNITLSPISVAASDQISKSTYPASSPQITPPQTSKRSSTFYYRGSSTSAEVSHSVTSHHYIWGNKHHHHHHEHHHCHATVAVRYVDQAGHLLGTGQAFYPNGPHVGQPYVSQPATIKNYQLVGTASDSLPTRGRLNKSGDNGTVTYIYAPIYHFEAKTINETIHYLDQDGQPVAPAHIAQPITFVTVENLVNHVTKSYFSTTSTNFQMDSQGNPRDPQNWHSGSQASFAKVPDPTPHGYQLVDQAQNAVPAITVKPSSTDLNITVRYQLKRKTAVIRWVDDRTGKTVSSKTVSVDVKHPQANLTSTYDHHDYRLISSDLPQGPLTFDEIKESGHLFEVHLCSQAPAPKPALLKPTAPANFQPAMPKPAVRAAEPLARASDELLPLKDGFQPSRPADAPLPRHYPQPHKNQPVNSPTPRSVKNGVVPLAKNSGQPVPTPNLLGQLDLKWRFPKDHHPLLTFNDWNNRVQKIIKQNGSTETHTQLGQVWYRMSGRMVIGQKMFENSGNS